MSFYCPQTKFAKVMFLHLSVSHSVHGGVCLSACWDTPLGADPPLRSACWEIRSTSGRYASYWNAILFSWNFVYQFQAAENGLNLGELDLTSQDFMLDEVDGNLRFLCVL